MTYDGSQLRSLFAYRNYNILGDSIVGWVGPCQVNPEFMVDGEDLNAGEKICGEEMLHFIFENFDMNLLAGVAVQRLMTSIALDVIREMSPNTSTAQALQRRGDDIFFENQKLSISIATVSPLSALIHFALNVSNKGTPVSTLSLEDLQCDPKDFTTEFFKRIEQEMNEIKKATQKVHWVK